MNLDTRVGWFILGCVLGFIVGYVIRSLREIRQKVEHVEEFVTHEVDKDGDSKSKKQKTGVFDRSKVLSNIGLLIVVILTAASAFLSQKASNGVKSNQEYLSQITACNQHYITKTVSALNARTKNSLEQIEANKILQEKQAEFFALILSEPKPSDAKARSKALEYSKALNEFVTSSNKTNNNIEENAYPTAKELSDCFKQN